MRKEKRITTSIFLAFLAMACLIFFITIAEAKGATGDVMVNRGGYTYILRNGKPRTGWITYRGKRYYAHKTKSRLYDRGAVVRNACKVKNGKMYYFDLSGAKITKNTRTPYEFYELNRHSTSIRYIYRTTGSMRGAARYNCMNHHMQCQRPSGKWKNDGWGYWWDGIDWQE